MKSNKSSNNKASNNKEQKSQFEFESDDPYKEGGKITIAGEKGGQYNTWHNLITQEPLEKVSADGKDLTTYKAIVDICDELFKQGEQEDVKPGYFWVDKKFSDFETSPNGTLFSYKIGEKALRLDATSAVGGGIGFQIQTNCKDHTNSASLASVSTPHSRTFSKDDLYKAFNDSFVKGKTMIFSYKAGLNEGKTIDKVYGVTCAEEFLRYCLSDAHKQDAHLENLKQLRADEQACKNLPKVCKNISPDLLKEIKSDLEDAVLSKLYPDPKNLDQSLEIDNSNMDTSEGDQTLADNHLLYDYGQLLPFIYNNIHS